jgi:hypothetical protein
MEHQHIRRLVLDAETRGSRKYTQEKGSKKKFHNKKATITVTLMTFETVTEELQYFVLILCSLYVDLLVTVKIHVGE